MVVVISTSGKVLGFPVPLDGFAQAWEESPTNAVEFKKRRAEIIQGIRDKQKKALEKPLNTDDLPLFGSAPHKQ